MTNKLYLHGIIIHNVERDAMVANLQ